MMNQSFPIEESQRTFHTKPVEQSSRCQAPTSSRNLDPNTNKLNELLPQAQSSSSGGVPESTLSSLFSGSTQLDHAFKNLFQIYQPHHESSLSLTDEIRKFVDVFCNEMIQVINPNHQNPDQPYFQNDDDCFSCPICYGIFVEPITSQCGHSYCRRCLQKEVPGKNCRRCSYVLTTGDICRTKVNVLLSSLVEKWWPNYVIANNYRNEGNDLFIQNQGDQALAKYSQAIDLCPDDHLSLGNRAQALLSLGRKEEALRDAEAAINACSKLAKGYFRKSVTLSSLGKYEDAFITLSICLYLVKANKLNDESAVSPLKSEFTKILDKLFQQSSSLGPSSTYRRHSVEQVQFSPYPRHISRKNREKIENEDLEYNSSDDEGDKYQSERSRFKMPRGSISTFECKPTLNPGGGNYMGSISIKIEHHKNKIRKLFERAIHETKLVHEEQKKVDSANQDNTTKPSVRTVDPTLLSANDFECTLCYRILFQPVTTVCGHTYCRTCLERCLDHSTLCPLCKTSLQDHRLSNKPPITHFVEAAITNFFPNEKEERLKQHLEEVDSGGDSGNKEFEIPIFVCTIGFPSVPCPLHVFEPRYRLMIRRSMEAGTRRFGMCCYLNEGEGNYADFGTLLEIKNVQYFADGRSVIDTVGDRRFKVLRRSQRDGYNTATIEFLQDNPTQPAERPRLQETHDEVYQAANNWLKSINQVLRQRIHTHFGSMPAPEDNWMEKQDGPSWTWWLLAILPLDTKAQLAILSMNSLQKRLDSIFKVLRYVKSNNM